MIRLFGGYEEREVIGYAVFSNSVLARATKPVALTALASRGLPQGSNAFTRSRFLVPSLMNWKGRAIFCDASDMLMIADVAELDELFDDRYAIQCVKHNYVSKHERKYVGTKMECDNRHYDRKNWASVMLINCEHPALRLWNYDYLMEEHPVRLLQFRGIPDEVIGELPPQWNVLADEDQPVGDANLLHWTAGIPHFYHYRNSPGADLWLREAEFFEMNRAVVA